MLLTYVFHYLAEKENLLFEVREREWLLTNAKLKKGKIYKVKLATVFHSFSPEFYLHDSQNRVQCEYRSAGDD